MDSLSVRQTSVRQSETRHSASAFVQLTLTRILYAKDRERPHSEHSRPHARPLRMCCRMRLARPANAQRMAGNLSDPSGWRGNNTAPMGLIRVVQSLKRREFQLSQREPNRPEDRAFLSSLALASLMRRMRRTFDANPLVAVIRAETIFMTPSHSRARRAHQDHTSPPVPPFPTAPADRHEVGATIG